MISRLSRIALPLLLAVMLTQRLSAHFLFVHVVRGAEPRIELHFAESAWDFSLSPSMVDILERVKARLPGGEALVFERRPFGMVAKLAPDQVAAAASLTYGIMARGGAPFLLEYHAKGVIGVANAAAPVGLGCEVLAEESSPGRLTITVLFGGKPAAGAEVVVPLEGMITEKVVTNADGQVVIATPATQLFSVRAMVAEERDGERDGKQYSLAKHYTTLTVHPSSVPDNCDGIAWAVLQDAASCCGAFVPADRRWSAKWRVMGDASGSGQLTAVGTRVRAVNDGDQLGAARDQIRLLGCFADPTLLNGAVVRLASDRSATAAAHVEVPALQVSFTIRDRHIETIQRASDAGSERVDVISWKMTHDERVLPRHLVVTTFGDDGRLLQTTMIERNYKEMEVGYVLDRQDCKSVSGLARAMRSSLRISEIESQEAGVR